MKRPTPFINRKVFLMVTAVFLAAVLMGVSWFPLRGAGPLRVDTPVRQARGPGDRLVVNLKGEGFTAGMAALLTPSIDNNQAIAATFPLPGSFYDTVAYRDCLYLGSLDQGLYAVDISEPRRPRLLKEYLPGRPVVDLLRIDDLLVAVCGQQGLVLFKIRQDGYLRPLGEFPSRLSMTKASYAAGYLYVAAGPDGLLSLKVSDPEQVEIATGGGAEGFVTDLFTFDGLLVAATKDPHQLKSYRLDGQGRFTEIAVRNLSGQIRSMVQKGNDLYVATTDGLSIYRVSPEGAFVVLGHFPELKSTEKLFSGSDAVYIFKNYSALAFLNVENFGLSSNYFLSSKVRTLDEIGDYLLVSGYQTGLTLIDKRALQPYRVSRAQEMSVPVRNLYFHQHKIYVMGEKGLFVMNEKDGAYLQQLSAVRTSSLTLFKNFLVAGHMDSGLEIFDISSGRYEAVATWPEIRVSQLDVAGRFILAASGIAGIRCIDPENISAPVVTASLAVHVLDFKVADDLVYLATKENGLMILRLSKGGEFQVLGKVNTPFPMNQFDVASALEIVGGKAYIANGGSGLLIADVEDPRRPKILSSLGLPGESKGLLVRDGLAMVLSGANGLSLVDVRHPAAPMLVGQMNIPGVARRIHLFNGVLYLPRTVGSLLALPAPGWATRVRVLSSRHMDIEFPIPKSAGHFNLHLANDQGAVTLSDAVVIRN